MKNRWEEDDEEFQDDNLFPDMDEELNAEYIKVLEKREETEVMKLYLIQKQLDYDILRKVISYLEKSWFWKFKSRRNKLNLIMETYQVFKSLINSVEEEE